MDYIYELAEKLVTKYKTRNPCLLAELAGVNVWFRPLGGLKGFYIFERKSRYIVINEDLEEIMVKVVAAHELGHDMLHRELSQGGIRETTLFLANNKTEREANFFAANVLISDKMITKNISDCETIQQLSYEFSVPQEIINYKLESMNKRGYKFNVSVCNNSFLA